MNETAQAEDVAAAASIQAYRETTRLRHGFAT
jgi:hypothetical protein